jgi:hypothetical protein
VSADPRQLAALAYFEMQAAAEKPRHGVQEIWAVEEFIFRTRRPLSGRVPRVGRLTGRRVA